MTAKAAAAGAYLLSRGVARPGRSREAFLRWQRRRLQAWLDGPARAVAAFKELPADLTAFPISDKSRVMASFAAYNAPQIKADRAWEAVLGDGRIGPYLVGASTGTSGNRGLFIISERERFLWLGTILAKALPDFWRRRERVAIVLPRHTRLYDSANDSGWLALRFFDLTQPLSTWIPNLLAFAPTVLLAPPKILRHFAERRTPLQPRQLYAAAETLDPVDRALIGAHFRGRLGEIYMATEGLLGVTCAHGMLHLAEDANVFEFEPVAGDRGLVNPIITSFRRTTQILARYRMNDLLRLSAEACPCGSPLTAVREVVGRCDDAFELEAEKGAVTLTPDILRNAVLDADRRIIDFRLACETPRRIALRLPRNVPADVGEAARGALLALLARHGVYAEVTLSFETLDLDTSRKLRRVENLCGRRTS